MKNKSNVITNIVVILFIVLGAIGFTLVISEYSDVVDNDIASRNYLQQNSIKLHELETDLCITINLGRNADSTDNAEAIESYVEKINSSMSECKELMKKYEAIKRNGDEEKQYQLRAGRFLPDPDLCGAGHERAGHAVADEQPQRYPPERKKRESDRGGVRPAGAGGRHRARRRGVRGLRAD